MPQNHQQLRLNKFLAERLGLSRRQADDAIRSGKVLVNDKIAILGERIDKNDKVCYNKKVVPFTAVFFYLLFNKPAGYVCSRKRQDNNPTIYELLPEKYQSLKTVGRLDKDSSGLILLTNDGDLAFSMTHPKFFKTKRYLVELDAELQPLHQQMIADFGVTLNDGVSKLGLSRLEKSDACPEITPDGSRRFFEVIMSEGRNRQIRRTFGALGYTVTKLHRIEFGKYRLSDLKSGEYQELSSEEV